MKSKMSDNKNTENKGSEAFVNPIDPDKVAKAPHILPYAHTVGGVSIAPIDKGKVKAGQWLPCTNRPTCNSIKSDNR